MSEYITTTVEETLSLGEKLGREAANGTVFALDGDLGAGKTVLTRGIARGMGLNEDDVCSPTFTIVNEYVETRDGRAAEVPLFHFDTYRLGLLQISDRPTIRFGRHFFLARFKKKYFSLPFIRLRPYFSSDDHREHIYASTQ